ncbi:uncharacterized protein LOC132048917 [Lycium ferocissimum]|uniref:uncharacterized protein LOC132048917 n=1 Tax=Lycium ferocissimum TaxID=112874 RepID=UPI002815E77A|nr:uncharacterized protein LOC132048917 [Lycium ferocissimum]
MCADRKVPDFEFGVGEQVLLKISPMKGVIQFEKRGKSSPRFLGSFEVLRRVRNVAYELALPSGLSIRWDSVLLDENLTNEEEPIAILNRQVRKLRSKEIASVKVQWKHHPVEEAT